MKLLKQITKADIGEIGVRYAFGRYLHDGWTGTILDLLNINAPFQDVLWVIHCKEYLSDDLMRLFAVFCARQVEHLTDSDDSKDAIDIAEQFSYGDVSKNELIEARHAAWEAESDATREAACSSARRAAAITTCDDGRYAACEASFQAAESLGYSVARGAAESAAQNAVYDAQRAQLIKMIKDEITNSDVGLA